MRSQTKGSLGLEHGVCCALLLVMACTSQSTPNAGGGVGGTGSSAGASATGASASADAAMLVREEKAFETATATHGADGWVSFFNDSSASFPGDQLIQLGRDAERRNIMRALPDTSGHLQWKPTYSAMAQSGDLGYTYGYYRLTARGPKGKVQQHTGTYVTIWRRQPDSVWNVAVDVGGPGPIPPGFFDSTAGPQVAH